MAKFQKTSRRRVCIVAASLAFLFSVSRGEGEEAKHSVKELFPSQIGIYFASPSDSKISELNFKTFLYENISELSSGYGYSEKSLWVRVEIKNDTNSSQRDWVFALDDSTPNTVDLILANHGEIEFQGSSGSFVPMENWYTRARRPNFGIQIPPGEERTVYICIRSFNILDPQFRILAPSEWASIESSEGFLQGLYFGASFAFFAYNFFLYLKIKDISFLLYCLFVVSTTATTSTLNGYSDLFLPWLLQGWQNYTTFLAVVSMICATIFCRSYLNTRKSFPKIDRLLRFMLGLYFLTILVSFPPIVQYTGALIDILTAITGLVFVATGIASLRSGYRPAQYYLLSWTTFYLMVLIWMAAMHNLIPRNAITSNGVLVGSALEMILVSFGLGDRIKRINHENEIAERKLEVATSLSRMGTQVAHDVLSPLSAIDSMIACTSAIPDDRRALIHSAINRISDIADALLAKNSARSTQVEATSNAEQFKRNAFPVHVFSLAHSLILEKKMQYRAETKIEIQFQCQPSGAYAYVLGLPFELGRVVSNIVDNAVESRVGEKGIMIEIKISLLNDGYIILEIADNGRGMTDELIEKIGRPGVTHGKPNGNGFGVSHALDTLANHGGTLTYQSEIGVGTAAQIRLPIAATPKTALTSLLCRGKRVVVVDDDPGALDEWVRILKPEAHVILAFSSAREFLSSLNSWMNDDPDRATIAIIDQEFGGEIYTGLKLCEVIPKSWEKIIASSSINSFDLQTSASRLGAKIMAKCQMPYIRLDGESATNSNSSQYETTDGFDLVAFDAAILDDNPWVCAAWNIFADNHEIKIFASTDVAAFSRTIERLPFDVPIFIDVMYGEEDLGYEIIKKLIKDGRTRVYGASSDFKECEIDSPYFRGNVGKKPPEWLIHLKK